MFFKNMKNVYNQKTSFSKETLFKKFFIFFVEVRNAREWFDRPPREHGALGRWTWDYLRTAWPPQYLVWSPQQVPEDAREPNFMGPNNVPLPPPLCWRSNNHGTWL